MDHFRVTFLPQKLTVSVPAGTTLLQAQIDAGLRPDAPCAGRGTCGKCLVTVNGQEILSCQTVVDRDMTVHTKSTDAITIRCDHYRARGKHCLVCVCNGQYYGGGFHPSLVARPDDGMLDVFIIKRMNIFQLIRYIGVYARGGADELPQFVTHLRTQELQLGFGKVSCMQVDGEAVYARRARIRLHPGAMKLIVPQGMRFFARDALVPAGAEEGVTKIS